MNNDLIIKTIFYHCKLEDKANLKLVNKMWYSNKDHIDPTEFLLNCLKYEKWDKYRQMYKYYGMDVDPTVCNNWAIRAASRQGHTEVVKLLLADPRVDPATWDNFAIIYASEYGHTDVIKLLLADPRVDPATDNNLPFRRASKNGHTEIVKLLLADPRVDPVTDDNCAIRMASSYGHAEVVKLLLADDRVNPAADDNYASENGRTDVVKLLLDYFSQK